MSQTTQDALTQLIGQLEARIPASLTPYAEPLMELYSDALAGAGARELDTLIGQLTQSNDPLIGMRDRLTLAQLAEENRLLAEAARDMAQREADEAAREDALKALAVKAALAALVAAV